MTEYPRDMRGYGANPPDPHWPDVDGTGPARIAVQFVINYEEGGENNILHGDAASEAFLSEIVGAQPWPGQRHWNMESIYEYGARAGFWRLHRMFTAASIPATVYGVTTALERSPEQTAAMIDAGWEIASHGLKWVEHKDMPEDEERAQIRDSIDRHTALVGTPPRGWYTGRCSMNTVRLASEEGEFDYIADTYADDLPYWVEVGDRPQLIVPYTLDCNDMRFATPQGFNSGDQFYAYLKDTFDVLYAEGVAGHAKMMSVGLHCRLVGRPGRAAALQRFLAYAANHTGVWFARRLDIALHWKRAHPFQRPEAGEAIEAADTPEADMPETDTAMPVAGTIMEMSAPDEIAEHLVEAEAEVQAPVDDETDLDPDGVEDNADPDPDDDAMGVVAFSADEFVARYGGIFEHSPWVAENALRHGAAFAETAEDMHDAMTAAFREGDDDMRLAVLNAHPDLAGKLAAARRLTVESTAEQASAGLDALTDDERSYFETLNGAYRDTFGFPFIMAVKGKTKGDILNAFETRLQNGIEEERATAEHEVEKIALLRLRDVLPARDTDMTDNA